MIGIPLGIVYGDLVEYYVHKRFLHGVKRGDFWGFHMHEHHRNSVLDEMIDDAYRKPFWATPGRWRETWTLTAVTLLHLPLAPVAPFFVATVVYKAVRYYRTHKRAHLDPVWAREHVPWHVDHHLGRNQDANWGVTSCWLDERLGTREPYVGTAAEDRDRARRADRNTSPSHDAGEHAA